MVAPRMDEALRERRREAAGSALRHRVGRRLGGGFLASDEAAGLPASRCGGRRPARHEPGDHARLAQAEVLGEDDRAVVAGYWTGASCSARMSHEDPHADDGFWA